MAGASGPFKSASLGMIMKLLEPRSCRISTIRGYAVMKRLRELSITKRELEILALIAQGMSNREIAEKLYVSENTVKTHSSRLFDKLSVKRRTQAVQIGKEMGLIP